MRMLLALLFFIWLNGLFAQQISSVSPDSAYAGQHLNVSITGQNTHFAQGSQVMVRFFQGSNILYSQMNQVSSNTQMNAYFQIPPTMTAGTYNLGVFNTQDQWIYKYDSFKINPWQTQLISIDPGWSYTGFTYQNAKITGYKTSFTQATNVNAFISQGSSTIIPLFGIQAQDDTTLSGVFFVPGSAPYGYYALNTNDSYHGHLTKNKAFLVAHDNGDITMVTPDTINTNQPVSTISIHGYHTYFKYEIDDINVIMNVNNVPIHADSIHAINDQLLKAYFSFSSNPAGQAKILINSNISGVLEYKWLVLDPTGIAEDDPLKELKIYQGEQELIHLDFSIDGQEDFSLDVFDLNGRRVYSTSFTASNKHHQTINSQIFNNEIYLFRLRGAKTSKTKKVFIAR